jgi:hypothetical protein
MVQRAVECARVKGSTPTGRTHQAESGGEQACGVGELGRKAEGWVAGCFGFSFYSEFLFSFSFYFLF